MKRPLRFYIAMIATRLSITILKMFGYAATHLPGRVALAFCPSFLTYIEQPKKLIAITGTNGKTTVSNMIADYFREKNVTFSNNSAGSNIQEGIIVTMLDASTFFGNAKKEVVVLEVDERVSYKIYPTLKPDVLIITNLFRDSYKRNAHPEYISSILERSIPDETVLVLNADDIISSTIKSTNKRLAFSIAALNHEVEKNDCLIHDSKYCPICHYPLTYHFTRYHHIGHVTCSVCGFKNIEADFKITHSNRNKKIAYGMYKNQSFTLTYDPFLIMELYNRLCAQSGLVALGYSLKEVNQVINKIKTVETRYQHVEANGKEIVLMLAKDQNPIAVSRVFDSVSYKRQKRVGILLINEQHENHKISENMAWYYDTDFERLNKDHITQIVEGGYRYQDFIVRAKLANIDPDKIAGAINEQEAAKIIDFRKVDIVYVLYGTKTIKEANDVKKYLLSKAKEVLV